MVAVYSPLGSLVLRGLPDVWEQALADPPPFGSGCRKRPSPGTYERMPISATPEGSSVGISIAPSHEYLGGRLVVGTPNSLVLALDASAVAVSEIEAVATMSPWRLTSCRTGASLLYWIAASWPLMPGMLRVVSPAGLLSVHAGA